MPISSLPLPGDEEAPDSSSQIAWLRSLGDREALFQIMNADRRALQSLEAAQALAQLGDVRGLDHLIDTLHSARSGMRMEAAEMLQDLGHPRGLRALQELQVDQQSSPRAKEREEAYEDLSAATTDELMAIWHENDRAAWTDLEFEVIEGILLERLGKLPRRTSDSGEAPEVDDQADPRIRQLWIEGDTDRLRRIMVQERAISLQLDAAEALADLGDEAALDSLIELLDDVDEERSDMAARILDWLDLPRGTAALRERGYEFETDGSRRDATPSDSEPTAASPLILPTRSAASEPPGPEQNEPSAWTSRLPKMPVVQGPDRGASSGTSFGTIVTGAVGGLLGFLVVRLGLDLLGMRPLPNGLSEWFNPAMVYSIVESLAVGAVTGSVGRRLARAMATRDGDDVDEQDARLVLGALVAGAAGALVLDALRFVFGA